MTSDQGMQVIRLGSLENVAFLILIWLSTHASPFRLPTNQQNSSYHVDTFGSWGRFTDRAIVTIDCVCR